MLVRLKKIVPLLLMLSCGNSQKQINNTIELDPCDQSKYFLIWNININDEQWKTQYLHYVGNCVDDTSTAKQLAILDAEQGNYCFLIYGLMDNIEPFENIYAKYPISFYNPGCVSSTIGEFYNNEMKKLLKQNEGLDYDSILMEEFITSDSVVHVELTTIDEE